MASKYDALRNVMGEAEAYNDKSGGGRILKWESNTIGATLAERKALAAIVLAKLQAAGITGVQKVQVRNAKTSSVHFVGKGRGTNGGDYLVSEYATNDKIAVYIDAIVVDRE